MPTIAQITGQSTTEVMSQKATTDALNAKQATISSSNKLSADLVDDTNTTNKFVTSEDKENWNAKQNTLTAGENIEISNDVIRAKDTTYTAGNGLNLNGTEFSADTNILATKSDLDSYYTKTETDTKLAPKLETEVVTELPTTGEEGKLYLTPKSHTTQTATGNPITATVAEQAGNLESFQLDGDTFQQSYGGKNLFDPSATPTVIGHQTFKKSETGFTATVALDNKTETWSEYIEFVFELKPNTTYSVSKKSRVVSGTSYRYAGALSFHNLDTSSYDVAQNADSITFTTGSVGKAGILFYTSYLDPTKGNVSSSIEFFDIQLEESASATPFDPYVGGQPSPNPDYPQAPRIVTGENVVKVTGKNMLKPIENLNANRQGLTNVVNDDGSITTSGKPTADWNSLVYPTVDITDRLEDGATYTISQQVKTNKLYLQVNARNKNTGTVQYIALDKATSKSFTVDKSNYTYIYTIQSPLITTWGDDTLTITNYYQLEKSSQATDFEPYQEQIYEVNLGKNLFDKNAITTGYYINSSGSLVPNNGLAISDYIPVEPNTPYTYSGSTNEPGYGAKAAWFTADKTWISSINFGHSGTITAPANAYYFRTSVRLIPGDPNTYQFEKGSTATTYAPYFEPIELCKIGEYQDYIWKDGEDWKVHKEIGEVALDGSESWVKTSANSGHRFWTAKATDIKVDADAVLKANRLGVAQADTWDDYGISGSSNPTRIYIRDVLFNDMTVEQLQSWLVAHNIIAYYALATPTDTVVTDQTLIAQLEAIRTASLENGANTITNTATGSNLAGDMEIGYYGYNPRTRYDKWLWLEIDNEYEQIGS